MPVAWIQQLYNDTPLTFWFRSVDTTHNGDVDGTLLDDGRWHPFPGPHQYSASWCGIPWIDRGEHYKDLSSSPNTHILRFWNYGNSIVFADGITGQEVADLLLDSFSADIDISLSITPAGIYFNGAGGIGSYGPSYCYIYDSDGGRQLVGRDEFASVLATVAGGTVGGNQGRKVHYKAAAKEPERARAQEESPAGAD